MFILRVIIGSAVFCLKLLLHQYQNINVGLPTRVVAVTLVKWRTFLRPHLFLIITAAFQVTILLTFRSNYSGHFGPGYVCLAVSCIFGFSMRHYSEYVSHGYSTNSFHINWFRLRFRHISNVWMSSAMIAPPLIGTGATIWASTGVKSSAMGHFIVGWILTREVYLYRLAFT